MKKVLIMLSTYNGEKYLSEQLDSLYAQEGVDTHILVRDDGSKDKTTSILEEYNLIHHNITIVKGKNVGATKSFHQLIQMAVSDFSGYDYYSFCDQDDVWYSDKICTAYEKLENIDNKYKLYFCVPEIVDEKLSLKNVPHMKIINNLYGNIVSSHILGCTMVLNYSLLEKVASLVNSELYQQKHIHIPLHDGWTALVAYALDAGIVYDQTPHIKYRQHGGNVVGAGTSRWSKIRSRIKRYVNKGGQKQQKCVLLYRFLSHEISETNKKIILKIINYKNGFRTKSSLLFEKNIYQYDIATNIGLFFMIVINKF